MVRDQKDGKPCVIVESFDPDVLEMGIMLCLRSLLLLKYTSRCALAEKRG